MNTPIRSTPLLAIIASTVLVANPAAADIIDGLVEYWTLDGDYSAGIDATHAGTLQAKGTGLAESGFVAGKFGQAIDLESSDANNQASVVIGGDENDFDFAGGAMSLSIWYTTESLYRDWQTLAGKGEGGSWRLARNRTTASELKISLWLVGDGKLDQQDGSWHHAVATIDASGHNLYVDGTLVASNTNAGNLGNNTLAMQIGGNPQAADRGWDGSIDDVGIWNRALTAEEVASIWNGGAGNSIATLINVAPPTFPLTITRNGPDFELAWESKAGMLYNVRSSPGLTGDLSTWTLVEADIVATPDNNTKTISNPSGPARFYRVEEFPKPQLPVYSQNFDVGVTAPALPAGWTTGANPGDTGTTGWQLGPPTTVGPAAANSAPNCIGTNLGAKYGISSNIWLRSPGTVDLTTATAATLTFRHWVDMDDFDTNDSGTVRVLDAAGLPATVTALGVLKSDIQGLNPAGWTEFSATLPPAALGKMVALEFQFGSDNIAVGDASGWYIDDIVVTASTP